jgi:hypothetical protein
MLRHIIVPEDLTAHEIEAVFAISKDLETKYDAGLREPLFPGRVLGLADAQQAGGGLGNPQASSL